jgi:hypothetical protein
MNDLIQLPQVLLIAKDNFSHSLTIQRFVAVQDVVTKTLYHFRVNGSSRFLKVSNNLVRVNEDRSTFNESVRNGAFTAADATG